ncbi:CDP-diacylglycerol--glycerol-3-phosphate 3-phosphatidyltransferase [Mycoplasmopsis primatum]|uniref:CDP-diacylglycerol--glycerol-3-phosphate 3-phosphatidyltransferase n=1 Tax=Mycoplasmopsis primatum TaxID=55604 RepID=UPI0009FDB89B|nr:CDP-diacylglycerol--glycerol-3-phosphate 3-phosphatidyltransferase [Mycoplasmopsis primatum]
MNLPNKLTILRIILFFPLLILTVLYWLLIKREYVDYNIAGRIILAFMLLIFIGAMVTDYFDGKIARSSNQITKFGKLWDPIADKLIVSTTLIALSSFGFIPIWITILFIARDLVVDASRVVMAQNNISVAASKWGKIKTLTQTIAIIIVLIIAVGYDYTDIASYTHLLLQTDIKVIMIVAIYLINLPTIIALFFSLFSGYKYLATVLPYIKENNDIDSENNQHQESAENNPNSN